MKKAPMTIWVNGAPVQVSPQPHETLMELLVRSDFSIGHSCDGNGTCGTCRVLVESESPRLSARTPLEVEMGNDRGFKENERLSCQFEPINELRVLIPD